MQNEMDIGKCAGYFHDGSLINIEHIQSSVVLSIESAEISMDENPDEIVLSEASTIKGKLHLEGVDSITENEQQTSDCLKMLHDSACILHLKVHNATVYLDLEWVNFPPHPRVTAYSFYVIHAKKIWWENIPDLFDPFW